jgi:hypothetical protein
MCETAIEEKGLIIPLPTSAMEIFKPGAIDPILSAIEAEVKKHTPDLTTKKGRDNIAALAYKVAKSKTYLDGLGKDLVAEWKTKSAAVDAERKRMRDKLDALKDEARQPLTAWEEAEEKRVADIRARIQYFHDATQYRYETADEVAKTLDVLRGDDVDDSFADLKGEAQMAKDYAVKVLEDLLAKMRQHEADQAELARLRKAEEDRKEKEAEEAHQREESERKAREEKERAEREERIRREAEEKAKREAEERELKLLADKEAAERREKEAAQRAEQEKAEAVRQAELKAKTEADRIERERLAKEEAERQEKARQDAEAARKAADVEHRRTVNQEALAGLIAAGLSEAQGKKVITAVASGLVPHVAIKY